MHDGIVHKQLPPGSGHPSIAGRRGPFPAGALGADSGFDLFLQRLIGIVGGSGLVRSVILPGRAWT